MRKKHYKKEDSDIVDIFLSYPQLVETCVHQLVSSHLELIVVGTGGAMCIPLGNTSYCKLVCVSVCVCVCVCVKDKAAVMQGAVIHWVTFRTWSKVCVCVWQCVTKAVLIFEGGLIHPPPLGARWCVTACL